MKEEINVIENSIFEGMKIFNELKSCKILLNEELISMNDKKYLSLYLGIINTENKISKILRNSNSRFNIQTHCKSLTSQKYNEILNIYFLDIFNQVNFISIDEYLNFLLNQEIVKVFNRINRINEEIFKPKNKRLIMQIK